MSHGRGSSHVGGALVSSSLSSHFVRWSSWVELRLHLCFVLQVNESLALWLSLVSTSHLLHRLWTLTAVWMREVNLDLLRLDVTLRLFSNR